MERQGHRDAEIVGRLAGRLGDVEADVGPAELLLGQARPLVAEDEPDPGPGRILADAPDRLGKGDQGEVMADRAVEPRTRWRSATASSSDVKNRAPSRIASAWMAVRQAGGFEPLDPDEAEVGDARVGQAPGGQADVLGAVRADQDDGETGRARVSRSCARL
ncbi:MAG: hypothetical protein MZV64_63745 [Ignavibacteriales bacterium]|nr:hypothetical protein [Ignavibacteriales bacterium]